MPEFNTMDAMDALCELTKRPVKERPRKQSWFERKAKKEYPVSKR